MNSSFHSLAAVALRGGGTGRGRGGVGRGAPVQPRAHEVVHDVVALCNLVEHVFHLGRLVLHGHLAVAKVCRAGGVAAQAARARPQHSAPEGGPHALQEPHQHPRDRR